MGNRGIKMAILNSEYFNTVKMNKYEKYLCSEKWLEKREDVIFYNKIINNGKCACCNVNIV